MEISPSKKSRVLPALQDETVVELITLVQKNASEATRDGCRRLKLPSNSRFSRNGKGYVQVKVVNAGDPRVTTNTKAQLHQVTAWQHPDPEKREALRTAIQDGKLELSHLCPNKDCTNPDHIVAESSWINKTRWGCPVSIFINDEERSCCQHNPACIPSDETRKRALRYKA